MPCCAGCWPAPGRCAPLHVTDPTATFKRRQSCTVFTPNVCNFVGFVKWRRDRIRRLPDQTRSKVCKVLERSFTAPHDMKLFNRSRGGGVRRVNEASRTLDVFVQKTERRLGVWAGTTLDLRGGNPKSQLPQGSNDTFWEIPQI